MTNAHYEPCTDFRQRVLGGLVRRLIQMDFNKLFDKNLTESERSAQAGNIYHALREFREVCKEDKSKIELLYAILDVDQLDFEGKVWNAYLYPEGIK